MQTIKKLIAERLSEAISIANISVDTVVITIFTILLPIKIVNKSLS